MGIDLTYLQAYLASHRQLVRFCLVGFCNTALCLAVIDGLKYFGHVNDVASNMVGYAAGLTLSFTLNSIWTFNYRGPQLRAVARFLAVFAVAYVANLATVMCLIRVLGVNGYIAQMAGMPVYTVLFYILSRTYAFAEVPPPA
mgnify:CR=1 FL=1